MGMPKRIKRRIIGVETECRVLIKEGVKKSSQFIKGMFPFTDLVAGFEGTFYSTLMTRAIWENETQSYRETTGFFFEYATPECLGARDVTLYETADLGIIVKGVAAFHQRNPEYRATLYKSNRDCEQGETLGLNCCGAHANYLTLRPVTFDHLRENLVPFLASRWCLIGNGWLSKKGDHFSFLFSQRGELMADKEREESGSTTAQTVRDHYTHYMRPFINTRDEPHADKTKWQRLHDISGNHTVSEPQNFLTYGSFDIVLAMIEEGFLARVPKLKDLSCDDWTAASVRFNGDLLFAHPVKLDNGESWTALDFQRFYLNEAKRYFRENPSARTEERDEVMKLWEDTLDALERHDFDYLARYLDFAAILMYLVKPNFHLLKLDFDFFLRATPDGDDELKAPCNTEVATKHGPRSLLTYLLQRIIEYAKIDVVPSLHEMFVARGFMDSLFSESELERARKTPPLTRATYRKTLRQWLDNETHDQYHLEFYIMDWSKLTFHVTTFGNPVLYRTVEVPMPNPYRIRTDPAKLKRFIEMKLRESILTSGET